MIGSTVLNYRIVQELGTGAMGTVYEAVDTLVERPVAIKVLRTELARQPELVERFRSEAVTLARLNHPNIALLYNFFQQGGDYFMAMEFVRGRPLESLMSSTGRMEPELAASVMSQILDGVAHAHRMGVLHRDIKPANVLVTGDGHVKVTDFGIARVLGSSRTTRHGRIIGTLEYIAPERIRGDESDPRSDLYSAGVVLYEMLAGRLPFTGQTDFELLKAHLEQEPPTLDVVTGSLAGDRWNEIVHRAMAKPPEKRFQSAEEFQQAVVALAGAPAAAKRGATIDANAARRSDAHREAALSPAVAAPLAALRKRPPRALMLVAAAVLLVLMIAVAMRLRTLREARKEAPETPSTVVAPASAQAGDTQQSGLTPPQEGQAKDAPQKEPQAKEDNVVVIPPTSGPKKSVATQNGSSEQRRKAALRALEGGDSGNSRSKTAQDKDAKRSEALKALEHQ